MASYSSVFPFLNDLVKFLNGDEYVLFLLLSDLLLIMLLLLGDLEGDLACRTVFTEAAEVSDDLDDLKLERELDFSTLFDFMLLLSSDRPRMLPTRLSILKPFLSDLDSINRFFLGESGISLEDLLLTASSNPSSRSSLVNFLPDLFNLESLTD